MTHHREIAHAVLRITVGVMLLFYGIGKFLMGVGAFVSGTQERLAGSPLPEGLVAVFATALPFLEVILGALLILGLYTSATLFAAGVLVMLLTFGTVMEPDPATVSRNVNYALVVFVLLWLVDYDRYSLDGWRKGVHVSGAEGREAAGGI